MTDDHQQRALRRHNKQLSKALGHAGNKIHELRCQLAESREINGKIARGEMRDLQREVERLLGDNAELRARFSRALERNGELMEKLRASEVADDTAR